MNITEDAKKFVGAHPYIASQVKYDFFFAATCKAKYGKETWELEVDRISAAWHSHMIKFEAHSPTV